MRKAMLVKAFTRPFCFRLRLMGQPGRIRGMEPRVGALERVVWAEAISFCLTTSPRPGGLRTVSSHKDFFIPPIKGSRAICLLGYLIPVHPLNQKTYHYQAKRLVKVTMCFMGVLPTKIFITPSLQRLCSRTGSRKNLNPLVTTVMSINLIRVKRVTPFLRADHLTSMVCSLRQTTRCSVERATSKLN